MNLLITLSLVLAVLVSFAQSERCYRVIGNLLCNGVPMRDVLDTSIYERDPPELYYEKRYKVYNGKLDITDCQTESEDDPDDSLELCIHTRYSCGRCSDDVIHDIDTKYQRFERAVAHRHPMNMGTIELSEYCFMDKNLPLIE